MNKDDDELDRLYESLTLDPTYVTCSMPPDFIKGSMWTTWWGRRGGGSNDIAYYDSDRELHRIYGPAYISNIYKYEAWYIHGKLHRVGGPAMTLKNAQFWFKDGVPHRLDGPAIIGDGRPKEYWIEGHKLSPKVYKAEIERRKRKGLIK